jgi:hypothetical protein
MCVDHSRRHIICRVNVYSCAQDKLISSKRCFLLFLFLVLGRSHVIALRRSHNDGHRKKTWRERPSNMISRRNIVRHDAQRQEVSRSNVPPRTGPCQIAEIVPMIMDIASQDQL